jgi:hypothetical protein
MADLRIVSGIVEPSGTVAGGSGFRVVVVDPGLYAVLLDTAFNVKPAVTATQIYPWPMNPDSGGGNTNDNAVIVFIDNDRIHIKVGDNNGNARARAFSFIAVGL